MGTLAFPDVGRHCSVSDCHLIDFLPFSCDGRQKQECMKSDKITATSIISVCSHSGFLYKEFHFFVTVSKSHSMISQAGLHGSIIDLLDRIGWLGEARDFINGTILEPDITTWMTLLDAWKNHDDLLSAKRIAKDILQMGLLNSAPSIEPCCR